MYAALLLAFLAVPPDAPPVMPPDAPPVSFQAWAAAEVRRLDDVSPKPANVSASSGRVDGVTSCRCGASCECVDCTCPDCPHRAVKDSLTVPPLTITVADQGCGPCIRFESDFDAMLPTWRLVEGRDYEIRVVPYGSETVPTFAYKGKVFAVGYGGWRQWASQFNAAKRPVESVRVTHDAQRHEAAKPVQTQPARLFVPRLPGTEWSGPEQSRESIISHLLNHPNHRGKYSAAQLHALDYRSLENLHDNDHNRHPPSSSIRSSSSQPVTYQSQSGGCPGGACPSPQRSGGLFGFGLFR